MHNRMQRANKNPNIETQLLATREKLKELVDMSKAVNRIYYHAEERQMNSWSFTHESIDIRSSSIICKHEGNVRYKNSYTHSTTKEVYDYAENICEEMTCSWSYPRCNAPCFNNILEKSAKLETGLNKATKYLKRHKELMKTLDDEIRDHNKKTRARVISQESLTDNGSDRRYDKAIGTDAKVFNKQNKKIEVKEKKEEINDLIRTKQKLQEAIENCDKLRRKFRKASRPNNQSQISIHDKLDTLRESLNTVILEVRNMKNVERDKRSKSCNSLRTIEEIDDDTSKEFRDRQERIVYKEKDTKVEEKDTAPELSIEAKREKAKNICINTDPLGVFALLRMSIESIRQLFVLLMFFPIVQIFCYFRSKLFSCHCGCSHKALKVFRHSGESVSDSSCKGCIGHHDVRLKLFSCQHCGETFIRAYCCQLHQKTCADRHGVQLDERPSLLFLK